MSITLSSDDNKTKIDVQVPSFESEIDHIPTVTGLIRVDIEAQKLDRRIRQSVSKFVHDQRVTETGIIASGMLRSFQQEQTLLEENAALRARMDVLAAQASKAAEDHLRESAALAQERERAIRLESAARAAEESRLRAEDRAKALASQTASLQAECGDLQRRLAAMAVELAEAEQQLEERRRRCIPSAPFPALPPSGERHPLDPSVSLFYAAG